MIKQKFITIGILAALFSIDGTTAELSVAAACADTQLGDGISHERLYECSATVAGGVPPFSYSWQSPDFNGGFANFAFFSRFCYGPTPVSVRVTAIDSNGDQGTGSGQTVICQ